jgi:hypothetical protein
MRIKPGFWRIKEDFKILLYRLKSESLFIRPARVIRVQKNQDLTNHHLVLTSIAQKYLVKSFRKIALLQRMSKEEWQHPPLARCFQNRYIAQRYCFPLQIQPMLEETIIEQWLTQRSDVALQKLLNHEPLTFEDNIVFALVGQREEIKRLEKKIDTIRDELGKKIDSNQDALGKKIDTIHDELKHEITDVKIALRDLRVEMNEYRRVSDDLRKSMVDQTRWTVALVALILTLAKVVDFLK